MLITKFTHGAWIVVIAMPLLFLLMKAHPPALRRGRRRARAAARTASPLPPPRSTPSCWSPGCTRPTLRALAYARATRPDPLTAVTVRPSTADDRDAASADGPSADIPVPLTVLDSPYRDITGPVLDYVGRHPPRSPRDVVAVFIPEYVVGRWWEHLLHNQSALRLKARLLFSPGVMVTNVP